MVVVNSEQIQETDNRGLTSGAGSVGGDEVTKDLIRIENHGRSTYLYIAGIRLGKGILGINFSQTEEEPMTPKLTVTVDVRAFLQELSEIKPEELEQAKEIIKMYLDGYKRTAAEDGNSSVEILR